MSLTKKLSAAGPSCKGDGATDRVSDCWEPPSIATESVMRRPAPEPLNLSTDCYRSSLYRAPIVSKTLTMSWSKLTGTQLVWPRERCKMSNVIRFNNANQSSKSCNNSNLTQSCEIIIFPGIRYYRGEIPVLEEKKIKRKRKIIAKGSVELKRRRGT